MENGKRNILIRVLQTVSIPVCLFLVLKIIYPANISMDTAWNMLYQAIPPTILAWGVTFSFKVGSLDLSPGATAMIAGIVGGNLAMQLNLGIAGVVLFCVIIGLACGALVGALFNLLKIPSIIVSIGVVFLLESLCGVVYGGEGVFMESSYVVLNSFIPQLIYGLVAGVLAYYMYNYRKFGNHIRAVGSNPTIAAQNGINVYRVKFNAFVITGLFAGLYAACTVGTVGVMRTVQYMGTISTVFDALMCMFAAMALARFANIVIAVYVGAVTLQLVKLLLMLVGLNSSYNSIIIAVFVLVFMCVSSWTDLKRMLRLEKYRAVENENEVIKESNANHG